MLRVLLFGASADDPVASAAAGSGSGQLPAASKAEVQLALGEALLIILKRCGAHARPKIPDALSNFPPDFSQATSFSQLLLRVLTRTLKCAFVRLLS